MAGGGYRGILAAVPTAQNLRSASRRCAHRHSRRGGLIADLARVLCAKSAQQHKTDVAAGAACVRLGPRSDGAVVKSRSAVCQMDRMLRIDDDCCAAGRRLRQLLQVQSRVGMN